VLGIVLPLGISFMTFQGIAYVVDVYRNEHEAERDLIKFLGFKAFFPQLIAGPIERASNLLDQFSKERTLDTEKVRRAVWLLIYGYALKIGVADSMAPIVNSLFVPEQPFGWSVVLGTVAFGLQIYGDFCGYSLIAKGAALLLGFELVWNFRFPYWATSIADFWRRWHVSLSQWLRDYLYIPLGGNRHGEFNTVRNLLITMALGGLWHGASWNFVAWGLLHGMALALWRALPVPGAPSSLGGRFAGWLVTMAIVFASWFLFRANSYDLLVGMLGALDNWEWAPVHRAATAAIAAVTIPLVAIEWLQQRRADDYVVWKLPRWAGYLCLAILALVSLALLQHHQTQFIYFQF
jgi:D-alanyl-lipoteichoic acid acyltransferase DltB (MBOAT superfamily)